VTETRLELADWDRVLAETDGPQIVVAGPGTGKTEFLVRRIASIIETGAARRDQIAMLTFSRRAAADVRRRIDEHVHRVCTAIAPGKRRRALMDGEVRAEGRVVVHDRRKVSRSTLPITNATLAGRSASRRSR